MYHTTITNSGRLIGSTLSEGLADAVNFGVQRGLKGNRITVYESVQDATGEIVHLNEALTFMVLDEPHKVLT